jgi:dGTPase
VTCYNFGMTDYKKSRGRRHEEATDVADKEGRTCFQKDRDRIIHCKAFRRLKDKTQVFVTHHDDHARNRLSHTIEVAQIARDMARMLELNEDLVEAIALAHDLGHTPFGHAGEAALNECLQEHGLHFEHNEQSQRIVEELEHVYPDFPGLNLSIEVLEGLMKHKTSWDSPEGGEEIKPSLEAQVVNLADEIAYQNHDVDDGLRAGLFGEEDLEELGIWRMAKEEAEKKYGEIEGPRIRVARIVSKMIGLMIHDVFEETKREGLVRFSPEMARANLELKDFLAKRLYFSEEVLKHSRRGQRIVKALFGYYEKEFGAAGARDFIAGMTDHFAEQQAEELQLEF